MKKIRSFLMVAAMLAVASFCGLIAPDSASAFGFMFEYTSSGTARASGYIMFSENFHLNNPGTNVLSQALGNFDMITALSITVTGATGGVAGGDGTFTKDRFNKFVWDSGGGIIDFSNSQNVIDQPVTFAGGDYTFGPPSPGGLFGDFSLYADSGIAGNKAPTFSDLYESFFLLTPGEDVLKLTSLVATPEPGTLLLLCIGLAGFALFRMRRLNGEGGCLAA